MRLPEALRMPRGTIRATRALEACDAMIEAAKQFEGVLVAHGLAADFLARFSAARAELEGMLGGRAAQVRTHVGAREGFQVQLRRARRAVERVDAGVKATFANDTTVLAKWRAARRVHQPSGVRTPAARAARIEMAVAA